MLEQAGADCLWVGEAYGTDALTALGYVAARTSRMALASGILNVYSRSAAVVTMSMVGLDRLSDGRAVCGLGTSGPAVVETLHGVAFEAPLSRLEAYPLADGWLPFLFLRDRWEQVWGKAVRAGLAERDDTVAREYGFEAEAEKVQDLFLDGQRAEAAQAPQEELVHGTALVGPPAHVRERVSAYRGAGVTMLNVTFADGDSVEQVGLLRALCDA